MTRSRTPDMAGTAAVSYIVTLMVFAAWWHRLGLVIFLAVLAAACDALRSASRGRQA